MSENFENGNWVHVDSYLRDDGTRVSEYWRRKYVGQVQYDKPNALSADLHYDVTYKAPNLTEQAKLLGRQIHDTADDILVNSANKTIADWGGNVFSVFANTPEAHDLYKIASPNYDYNFEYAQKNGTMYNSTEDLHDEKLEKKIKARLLIEGTGMQDCKVFVADENSSLSQKIADSDELKEIIKSDIQYIRRFNVFPAKGKDIEFTSPDLYNAIHGANISDAKFDKDGNLYLSIEDLYNFNKGRTSVKGRIGEKLQNQGDLIPFYMRVNVKIPKSELDKY